ncbi:MAG: acetylglutamate kinase, partial [Desulfatiglandales bacterium]
GRAQIIIEALPYIKRFNGSIMVIKYGGHAMLDEGLKEGFALDITLLRYVGIKPIVVHGGGPQIGKLLKELSVEPHFVDGLRVTDERTMDVVEMVLTGQINKEIVTRITMAGGRAVGISGKDASLIVAKRLLYKKRLSDGGVEEMDLGLVGEVQEIRPDILFKLADAGFIPVVSPVASGVDGKSYNLNADTAAGHIAMALKARKLILLTDTQGVLDGDGRLISSLTKSEAERLIEMGVIKGGMIPKVQCCLDALQNGVRKAHILDGRIKHALLLELFSDSGVGTEIVLEHQKEREDQCLTP